MYWTSQRTEELLGLASEFVRFHVHHPRQLKLLQRALAGLQTQLKALESPPLFITIPLLVHSAIRGDEPAARVLAIATTLLFLGIDILDDIADGDLPAHWQGFKASEIHLAGATLLATLPQIAIATLKTSSQVIAAMHKTLAEGLLKMSAGQESDLTFSEHDDLTSDVVEASVVAKSGEEIGLFASLAAQLAQAPQAVVEHYAVMGRELGTAGQLVSDCHDLFQAQLSRDLANGTRTFPLALYLEKKRGQERQDFLLLLEQARQGRPVFGSIRQCLHESGVLRMTAFVVELHCQRAQEALLKAKPLDPAAFELSATIDNISFFPKSKVA